MRTATILFLFVLSAGAHTFAASKIKECGQRQDIVSTRFRQNVSSTQMQGLLLVGKKATYQVESANGKFKVISEQSFETGVSKIICGSGKAEFAKQSFSMYAPTLIDNRKQSDASFSFWQFQISADDSLFGIWNKKSRVLSQTKEAWDEVLEKHGIHYQIFQLTKNLYEIHLQKSSETALEQLLIRYDVASEL